MRRLPTREEARMHQLLTVGEAGERGLYCHHTTTTDASCWDSQQTTTHDFRFVTSPCQRSRDVHRRFSSSCELSLTVSHIEQYCERGGRYNPHPLTILLLCHTHSVSCGAQNRLLGEAPREKNGYPCLPILQYGSWSWSTWSIWTFCKILLIPGWFAGP